MLFWLFLDDCFKKWNNLRTYFQAEVKSVKIKNNGGTSDGDEISGGWKYSSKMSFLIGTRLPQIAVNSFNNNEHSVLCTELAFISSSNKNMYL